MANSMAASAAYWIASAADQVIVTPSGDVGSVGVYTMHVDYSEALANEGIKVNIVKAGKYKAELSPYHPLSDEGRDFLQEQVDDTYSRLVKTLARNRDVSVQTVRNDFGQGRIVPAAKAVEAKMADRIMTFSELLNKLTAGGSKGDK